MAYATLDQLKEYLDVTDTANDALLTRLLDAATAEVERWTGRVFQADADSTRKFHAVEDTDVDRVWLHLDRDLAAITSVVNGDGTDITADIVPFPPDPPHSALRIRISSTARWTYTTAPEEAIAVTGRWAYSVTPPADVVQATIRLAAYAYRQRDAQVFDVTAAPGQGVIVVPRGFPADVRVLLAPYRRFWA